MFTIYEYIPISENSSWNFFRFKLQFLSPPAWVDKSFLNWITGSVVGIFDKFRCWPTLFKLWLVQLTVQVLTRFSSTLWHYDWIENDKAILKTILSILIRDTLHFYAIIAVDFGMRFYIVFLPIDCMVMHSLHVLLR